MYHHKHQNRAPWVGIMSAANAKAIDTNNYRFLNDTWDAAGTRGGGMKELRHKGEGLGYRPMTILHVTYAYQRCAVKRQACGVLAHTQNAFLNTFTTGRSKRMTPARNIFDAKIEPFQNGKAERTRRKHTRSTRASTSPGQNGAIAQRVASSAGVCVAC